MSDDDQKYVTHTSHAWEIEEADDELLLQAAALISPDSETQDTAQRWKNAAAQIIATKTLKIAALQADRDALLQALKNLVADCGGYEAYDRPCLAYDKARAAIANR